MYVYFRGLHKSFTKETATYINKQAALPNIFQNLFCNKLAYEKVNKGTGIFFEIIT